VKAKIWIALRQNGVVQLLPSEPFEIPEHLFQELKRTEFPIDEAKQ